MTERLPTDPEFSFDPRKDRKEQIVFSQDMIGQIGRIRMERFDYSRVVDIQEVVEEALEIASKSVKQNSAEDDN